MEKMFMMNLQLFAEPEAVPEVDTPQPEATKPPEPSPEPEKPGKTFTQDELDAIIQKRLDRALSKAEQERKEAEELAKLSEKERSQKEMEKREQEIELERQSIRRERLELQTTKELTTRGLDPDFAPFVLREDAETTKEAIDRLQSLWQRAVETSVNERLKTGYKPVAGQAPSKLESLKTEYEKETRLDRKLMLKNQIFEIEKETKG